jgi:hypothetical protein
MAARYRLTNPDWPDHADLGRSIAAASGASSWSGQRRFESTRVAGPAAYVMFCQNSPALCAQPAPTPPNPRYVQFCWNSPSLCTVSKRD